MAEEASIDSNGGWRVKLYQLNDEGQWDDRGTGKIRVRHSDVSYPGKECYPGGPGD